MRLLSSLLFVVGLFALFPGARALASDPSNIVEVLQSAEEAQTNLNYVWTILAAALVFFMQAGFALLEAGFSRAKNAVNIIMKNVMDASSGRTDFF
jgi:Amt family ammonium transporter